MNGRDQTELVQYLLSKGANIFEGDEHGKMVLYLAEQSKNEAFIKFMKELVAVKGRERDKMLAIVATHYMPEIKDNVLKTLHPHIKKEIIAEFIQRMYCVTLV
eukprot:TRINITY_DN4587_c0_g1_i3.p4 TRINITY_DN4587_c0_g1~~TRINITY_DN4587_c0_g1_i3.p4  ORF type:complete len:103 (+),score=23.70 TRINITY_DN4587_c0_g1_i3:589-897(+)